MHAGIDLSREKDTKGTGVCGCRASARRNNKKDSRCLVPVCRYGTRAAAAAVLRRVVRRERRKFRGGFHVCAYGCVPMLIS